VKKAVLDSLFARIKHGGLSVIYWDGEEVNYGTDVPKAKVIIHRPPAFTLDDPVLAIGEAYMDEIIDFEGSLEELFQVVELNKESLLGNSLSSLAASAVKTINNAAAKLKQKENIRHHYDLGNDFFSLWLDDTMSYSCGYFKTPHDSLNQAQIQKIDHTLKKLQLRPGERLLDIGSGWGWLIIRAAQQYGVNALGITLSEEQYKATKQRINDLGLSKKVDVMLLDYLDLDDKPNFDKIVSVGMFEHVGKENLPKYMKKVYSLLKHGGLSLLHTITGKKEGAVNSWMKKYIFPGGYIPSVREIIWLLPEYDFHLIHAESLRMHYAMTLDKWHENFSKHINLVEEKFGKRFVRMWRLYLLGCAASFRSTGLNIHQFLFSKGLNNELPLTLDHIYAVE